MHVRFNKCLSTVLFCLFGISMHSCQSQQPPALPGNADENSLLWEISGNGLKQPSFLFGTFHLLCKDQVKFSDNLLQALKQSEEVYFEMDLDDPANTLGAMFFMNMKQDKTLKDLYTEEEYSRLNTYFKDSVKMSLAAFQKMKPALLETILYPKMMPCKTLSGVEMELMTIAKKEKKNILGFETIAFQTSVFDSIPYEEQAKSLLKTIDSIGKFSQYFDEMMNLYLSQRLEDLAVMLNKPEFGLQDDLDILLDKRNMDWVEKLQKILPGKNVFIAVGAGHLVGDKGLISLLKKEGYTLRPILNK